MRSVVREAGDLARTAARLYLEGGPGADAAIAQKVAGLVLLGLDGLRGGISADERTRLRAAARREAADHAVARGETDALLERLERFRPAILKGRALAGLWPAPELRPPGDLDLLLDEEDLEEAARLLVETGFRQLPGEPQLRLRRGATGVELVPPAGRAVGVDLHARPFRSVGHRLAGPALLARARTDGSLRRLDDADRLLFTFVHAAKHAVRGAKWLFDLIALSHASAPLTVALARHRAVEARVDRAFDASAWLAAQAGAPVSPVHLPLALRPLFSVEQALTGTPVGPGGRYALELLLEQSVRDRARMAAGFVERRLRAR
jgi:hypothetical protein